MKRPHIEERYLYEIHVIGERRPIDSGTVDRLAASIEKIGLQHPITVRYDRTFVDPEMDEPGGDILVAGLHRLEAVRSLGWDSIDCVVVKDWDERQARLWEIAENLHRADLTAMQRADQVAEWIRLTEEVQSAHFGPIESKRSDGRGHRRGGGVNAAARELGLERKEAQRALKIADIDPEAKEAAHEAGLDTNQSALLKVAAQPKENQLNAVNEIATKPKRERKKREKRAPDPVDPSEKDLWFARGLTWWNSGHIEWHNEFLATIQP